MRSIEELLALSKTPHDPVESAKNSIRRIHEQSGAWGISPGLITARTIVEEKDEEYLYNFFFELTGMTKEDFEERKVSTKVDSSLSRQDFNSMNRDTAKKEILKLRKFLEYHEKLYYTDPENVEISDYEYDMAMKDLEKLEELHPDYATEKSVTKRVGFDGDGGSETQKSFDGSLEKFL